MIGDVSKKLQLYVWSDFMKDYAAGLAFAIARNEDEARFLVVRSLGYEPQGEWGAVKVLPLSDPLAFAVLGGS